MTGNLTRADVEARIQARSAAAGIGSVRVRWHRSQTTNARAAVQIRGGYQITVNTGCLADPEGVEHVITHELGHIACGHIRLRQNVNLLALLLAVLVAVGGLCWKLLPGRHTHPYAHAFYAMGLGAIGMLLAFLVWQYRIDRATPAREFEADAWAAAQGVPLTRELADHLQAKEDAHHPRRIPGWPVSHPSWAARYQHPANQAALASAEDAAAQ